MLIAYDGIKLLPNIDSHTLILNGEFDKMRRNEDDLLKGIRDSELRIISNTAALPSYEQPDVYCEVLYEFLTASK